MTKIWFNSKGTMQFLCSKIAGRMADPLSANPHAHTPVCPMSWTPGGRIRKGLCPSSSGFWQLGLLGMGVALEMADVLNRCWEWGQEVGEAPGWETSPIYKEKVLAQGALGQRFPWTKGPWEREQCFQALVPSSNGSSGQRGGRWGNVQMSIHRRLPNLDTTCLNKKKFIDYISSIVQFLLQQHIYWRVP